MDHLLPHLYAELRKLAAGRLRDESPGQTIQATELVHEAYLRLVDAQRSTQWSSRAHFFVAVADAMRRILIERARRKTRLKHGGLYSRTAFDEDMIFRCDENHELIAIDELLLEFAEIEPKHAELVKLRFFAGFSIDETAEILGISRSTAKRSWAYARAWLTAELVDFEPSK